MGLETGNYISDLTPAWPTGSESKSQGDDHLRLIKTVVKNTFPNGSRPFYFPVTESISGTLSLDATDWNNIVEVDTTAGDVTVNLPSTLGASDKGWSCEVVKISNDANAALVAPAAGTILTKVGDVATVRVGVLCEPARFIWNGTAWRCSKPGPMIGSAEEFDGPSLPPGYLWENGTSFSSTNFAELYKALGSSRTTSFDKRGRLSFSKDNMGSDAGRLTTTNEIDGDTLAAVGGAASETLAAVKIPTLSVSLSMNQVAALNTVDSTSFSLEGDGSSMNVGNGGSVISVPKPTNLIQRTGTTSVHTPTGTGAYINGAQTAVQRTPQGIIVNRILRAC